VLGPAKVIVPDPVALADGISAAIIGSPLLAMGCCLHSATLNILVLLLGKTLVFHHPIYAKQLVLFDLDALVVVSK
jgi:hypothetical protein